MAPTPSEELTPASLAIRSPVTATSTLFMEPAMVSGQLKEMAGHQDSDKYSFIANLDDQLEDVKWEERNTVITAMDHQAYIATASEIVLDIMEIVVDSETESSVNTSFCSAIRMGESDSEYESAVESVGSAITAGELMVGMLFQVEIGNIENIMDDVIRNEVENKQDITITPSKYQVEEEDREVETPVVFSGASQFLMAYRATSGAEEASTPVRPAAFSALAGLASPSGTPLPGGRRQTLGSLSDCFSNIRIESGEVSDESGINQEASQHHPVHLPYNVAVTNSSSVSTPSDLPRLLPSSPFRPPCKAPSSPPPPSHAGAKRYLFDSPAVQAPTRSICQLERREVFLNDMEVDEDIFLEAPIPIAKEYNLDFLETLEDLTFNPFETKTVIKDTLGASTAKSVDPSAQVSLPFDLQLKDKVVTPTKPSLERFHNKEISKTPLHDAHSSGLSEVDKSPETGSMNIVKTVSDLSVKHIDTSIEVKEERFRTVSHDGSYHSQPASPPMPMAKGYNLDFLEKCDDPNFNPFETKTAIQDTFGVTTKSSNELSNSSNLKDSLPTETVCEVSVKFSDTSIVDQEELIPIVSSDDGNHSQPTSPPMSMPKGYNLDFLEMCDDPNFNPFETKTTIQDTFGVTTESSIELSNPTIVEDSLPSEANPKKESAKKTKPGQKRFQKKIIPKTPMRGSSIRTSRITVQSPTIKKETTVDNFITDSVNNVQEPIEMIDCEDLSNNYSHSNSSPPLAKPKSYNLDFLDMCDDPNFNPFETKIKVVDDLSKSVKIEIAELNDNGLHCSNHKLEASANPSHSISPSSNDHSTADSRELSSDEPYEKESKDVLSNSFSYVDTRLKENCSAPQNLSPDNVQTSATPKTVKFCENPPTKISPQPFMETTSEDRIEFLLNKIKSLKEASDLASADAQLSQSDCSFSLPSNLTMPEDLLSPAISSPTHPAPRMDYTMNTTCSMLDQDQSVLASQGGDLHVSHMAAKEQQMKSILASQGGDLLIATDSIMENSTSLTNMTSENLSHLVLIHEAKLLDKDKQLASIGHQILIRQGEIEKLSWEVSTTEESNSLMIGIVGEFEKTISQLIKEKEKENVCCQIEREKTEVERNQILEDLQAVERAFKDLHKKYERTKEVINAFKSNEDILKTTVSALCSKYKKGEERYDLLKTHAETKLEEANTRLGEVKRSRAAEIAKLTAQLRKSEMGVVSLEREVEQKTRDNQELTTICDELISNVGK